MDHVAVGVIEIVEVAAGGFTGYSFVGGAVATWFYRWRRSKCDQCPPLGPKGDSHQEEHVVWAVAVGATWPVSLPATFGARVASLPARDEIKRQKLELSAKRRAAEIERLERELEL